MMEPDEIVEGNVCRCRAGKIGVVTAINQQCGPSSCGTMFFGETVEGKPWQSSVPTKIAESLDEFFQQSGMSPEDAADLAND